MPNSDPEKTGEVDTLNHDARHGSGMEGARVHVHMGVNPKMVGFPNWPMGFPTQNDQHLGCEMGGVFPPFKERPIFCKAFREAQVQKLKISYRNEQIPSKNIDKKQESGENLKMRQRTL